MHKYFNDKQARGQSESPQQDQHCWFSVDQTGRDEIASRAMALRFFRIHARILSILYAVLMHAKHSAIEIDNSMSPSDTIKNTYPILKSSLYDEFFRMAYHGSVTCRNAISVIPHFSSSKKVSPIILYPKASSMWNANSP